MRMSALLTVLTALVAFAAQAHAGEPPTALSAWIEREMREWKIPGLGIAVGRDYRIEWTVFGLSDVGRGLKAGEHTLFQAASVSKPPSSIAAMIALEEHGLSLDEDVNTVFAKYPARADIGAWRLPNPFPTPVTFRMLLSHTGGASDFRYSGYRYGYYAKPPSPIDPIPTMREELEGLPPADRGPVSAGRLALARRTEGLRRGRLGRADDDARRPPETHDRLPEGAGRADAGTHHARKREGDDRASTGRGSGREVLSKQRPWQGRLPLVLGLGFDVNLTKHLEHRPDGEPAGDYFAHTGFNSGYLAVLLGGKTGGRGVAIMVNVAPEDMSGAVPQFEFLTKLVRRIADEEQWP